MGYISPEIKSKKGYNYMNDVYHIGIFLYDLLHGALPFDIYDPITKRMRPLNNGKLPSYRAGLSEEVKDLMNLILGSEPEKRLGGENNIIAILHHPWFKKGGIDPNDWSTLVPPIIPDLSKVHYDKNLDAKLPSIIRALQGRST